MLTHVEKKFDWAFEIDKARNKVEEAFSMFNEATIPQHVDILILELRASEDELRALILRGRGCNMKRNVLDMTYKELEDELADANKHFKSNSKILEKASEIMKQRMSSTLDDLFARIKTLEEELSKRVKPSCL